MQTTVVDAPQRPSAARSVLRLSLLELETSPERNLVRAGEIPRVASAIMMFVMLRTSANRPKPLAPRILAMKMDSAKPLTLTNRIPASDENVPLRMNRRMVTVWVIGSSRLST